MKEKVIFDYEEEKLRALNMVLQKEHSSVQQHLTKTLDELYLKRVPEAVREFIGCKAVVKAKRQVRSAGNQTNGSDKQNREEEKHEQ